jgi:hypothetical protein
MYVSAKSHHTNLGQIQGCRFSSIVVIPVHMKNLHVHKKKGK